jgi:hypothetical protein
MDDLSSWCEVLQALLPGCFVRVMWDGDGAIVAATHSGRAVWLSAGDLAGRTPSRIADRVRRQLRSQGTPVLAHLAV